MSENKRYYWLKLNENFFEDDTVTWIEEQANGKDYVIFYLKLCLKSLGNDGYLVRYVGNKLIPYDINALAKLTNTPADTVAVAMKQFIEIGLVTRLETGEIYMNQINEMIGNETDSARRMRKKRALEDKKTNKLTVPSHCDIDVQKSDTEIEIEIDKEIDKDTMSGKAEPPIPFKEIVSYLNEKAGTNYQHSGKKTRSLITARWNEGFKTDDFKKVVAIKTKEWLNDKDMSKFLRPETLFGTKFEGYLNQKEKSGGLRGYDTDEYDNFF